MKCEYCGEDMTEMYGFRPPQIRERELMGYYCPTCIFYCQENNNGCCQESRTFVRTEE